MIKKGLEAIVGRKNVLSDEATLEAYSKDLSLSQPRRPQLVVKPKDVEEVQKVVKLANKQLIPVIPVSSGVHFHGEAIPEQGGNLGNAIKGMEEKIGLYSLNDLMIKAL